MRWLILACAIAAAACSETSQQPAAPAETEVPALTPISELAPRDLLLECAGAILADSGLDPMADPSLGTPAEDVYFTILALMDREPGLEGLAGREAAADASEVWRERSAEQRAERASACMQRFGG